MDFMPSNQINLPECYFYDLLIHIINNTQISYNNIINKLINEEITFTPGHIHPLCQL